jgi:RIO-like serine/threonine protein kinase
LAASGTTLKAGDRTTVVRIDAAGTSWVLKRYNLRGPVHTAAHLMMASRAERSWHYGRLLLEAGLATPRPMAYVEHRLGPLRTRSFVLTEFAPGTLLSDILLHGQPTAADRYMLPAQFAELWRRLSELRLTHGDAKATNYLVTDDGRLCMIDLDSMRLHRQGLTFLLARRRDWKRFMRNWQSAPELAQAFRSAVERSNHVWIAPPHFRTLSSARRL